MKIGLIDIDSKIPNLALMKLSTYHKGRNDDVEIVTPIFASVYDKAYASQVFTWTDTPCMTGNVELGGTGIDIKAKLPSEVESVCPDYSLYKMDYSMGFLTRGCPRKCRWCFVPEKEGNIRGVADIEDFVRHKKVVLLDNNVLASDHGLKQINKITGMDIRIDFNQGLDARLIDKPVAELLSRVKWIRAIRLACDTATMKPVIEKAVNSLREAGFTKEIWAYMLVEDDIEEAHDRAMFLSGLNVTPFAQPYRSPDGKIPGREARDFARWVNRREIFKRCSWKDYKTTKHG